MQIWGPFGMLFGFEITKKSHQKFDRIFSAEIFIKVRSGDGPRRLAGPHSAKAARADFVGKVEQRALVAWRTLLTSVRAH